jgi:FkbM family methyltransferase
MVAKYYKRKFRGFFVDVGAYDGVKFSNSLLLESRYKWKGVNVEANPNAFQLLVKNRPNAFNVNKAVYSKSGEVLKFSSVISGDNQMLSGLSDHLDVYKDFVNNEQTINNMRVIEVETETLTSILDRANAPCLPKIIDYLSVDVEGAEVDVLKGIDFSKYKFGYITIEHNNYEINRTQINKILTDAGYLHIDVVEQDDIYVCT